MIVGSRARKASFGMFMVSPVSTKPLSFGRRQFESAFSRWYRMLVRRLTEHFWLSTECWSLMLS